MIITGKILREFDACEPGIKEFEEKYPSGYDISALWTKDRAAKWLEMLTDDLIKRYVGWAIRGGVLPARIEADLSGANLRWADLSEANLSSVDLSDANLIEANLSRTDLRWADLSGVNLRWADLTRADLRWANLTGADLTKANLSETNLSETNLSEANLTWADLHNVIGYKRDLP